MHVVVRSPDHVVVRSPDRITRSTEGLPDPRRPAAPAADPGLAAITGMIFKEENTLLPMALETLMPDDWADIWRDSPVYGWCLVEGYYPPAGVPRRAAAGAVRVNPNNGVTGVLDLGFVRVATSCVPILKTPAAPFISSVCRWCCRYRHQLETPPLCSFWSNTFDQQPI
jgi:hypothetical protein